MPVRNLRPVFYSLDNQRDVLSGWINPQTLDVFTTKADNEREIEVVPRALPAFHTGERVEFTNTIELYPAEDIRPRDRGHVAAWDIETGAVSIYLEGVHDGLEDNTLIVTPFHDDWIVCDLKRFTDGKVPVPFKRRRGISAVWKAFWLGLAAAGAPFLLAHAEGLKDVVGTLTEFFY